MNLFDDIRKEYPALERWVYLDSATTGLISRKSYEAMRRQLDARHFEGVSLGRYFGAWDYADEMRKSVAEMIHALEHEIFYGKDCSDINNALMSNIAIPQGANVVMADITFPSTRNAWLNREADGLEVRFVESHNGAVSFESILDLVDEHTFAISVCHVEPSSGFRHDLYEIGQFCHENNILFTVDATQSLGAISVDVKAMHVDFLAASTYKWMNNVFGFGIGYMSEDLLDRIKPATVGWVGADNRVGDFNKLKLTFNKGAQRFETGGLNWIGLYGLEQSIKAYMSLGEKSVENYILGLTDDLYKEVEASGFLSIVEPFEKKNRSNIVYIRFPREHRLDDDVLEAQGIRAHVASEETMRVGLHFYNCTKDIESLMDFFKKLENRQE